MLGRADAERAPVQLAGIGLGVGQKLGQRLPRRIGLHHHAHDEAGDLQDVGEVVDRIVGQLLVQQRLAQHAHMHLRDRVAVGLGLLQRHRAHDARGARLVVDDDLLAELLRRPTAPGYGSRHRPARRAAHGMISRIGRSGNFACARAAPSRCEWQGGRANEGGPSRKAVHASSTPCPQTLITRPCKGQATACILGQRNSVARFRPCA